MTEQEKLERAIAALEGQRTILSDSVVDAALASMREKLAALQGQPPPTGRQRKQVTVLFADLSNFTALAETLDAEEITEMLNGIWARLDELIEAHGGVVDKHIGDSVMALWGTETVREDDPERAVFAALAMREALLAFREKHGLQLNMRLGLNTEPVLLGRVGSTGEFTATGDAVNLAARMEQAAPVGGVLISHDTYQHVRGVFDVLPQAPIVVKGKSELVQTYIVQQAKPRAFRVGTRGVEGIKTRMVGREAELLVLKSAFADAVEAGETRLVTVIGEAGVGKSRLLYEFENWLKHQPEEIFYFKGRAAPASKSVPYSILRDMFALRFNILESDGTADALHKFRAGMQPILTIEQADLVGHLIGFDFSSSPAVRNLLGSHDIARLASAYLINYVRTLAEQTSVLIFLEDIHWADDSSLELIERFPEAIPQAQLMLVGLARPVFFEQNPHWGQKSGSMTRIELKLLSRRASRSLVMEILKKVQALPDDLRDMIVDRAEGNPYYVEEMVKMLLDVGVIERGKSGQKPWRINQERLARVRVPQTLTGILQARLDSLPAQERDLLQKAAVIGRVFWDAAVADLAEARREHLLPSLEASHARELIFRRARSDFAETHEYIFKHSLLRDVTYETVLLKTRRDYHARVARWLESNAGERIDEYAAVIAEHLQLAGQTVPAVAYLHKAAEKVLAAGTFREALSFFRRALSLLPEDDPARIPLFVKLGEALTWLGHYAEARAQLEAGLVLSERFKDDRNTAAALGFLGWIALEQGHWDISQEQLEKSLALARQEDNRSQIAWILGDLGWLSTMQIRYPEARNRFNESLALYQELRDRLGQARALNGLGSVANALGEYEKSKNLRLQGLALARQTGNRREESVALGNLGWTAWLQKDYQSARQFTLASLEIDKEIGNKMGMAVSLANLGDLNSALGDYAAAAPNFLEALKISAEIGAVPRNLGGLAGLAEVLAQTGQPERALELLGVIMDHPALENYTITAIEQTLTSLRARLTPEKIEAGLARGKALQLESVVAEILVGPSL